MKKYKKILVCPLDWGLGHATRMVPVIEMLESKGALVSIAADNRPLTFLKLRFPKTDFVQLPGFTPFYPEQRSMAWTMIKSIPHMRKKAKEANQKLQQLISEKQFDAVISDNRYELYSNKIPSIFVTHQLKIHTSGWQKLVNPILKKTIDYYLQKYNEVWIPDVETEPNLSGKLSHLQKMPVECIHFIGPLSRFSGLQLTQLDKPLDILILISGPEPQRSIFEEMLTKQAIQTGLQTVILQGKPEKSTTHELENVKIIPHLPDTKLAALIQTAKVVVSRPGYSTLMDLAAFGKKAIFIPTPGQTEQEYLARQFMKKGIAFAQKQDVFSLEQALQQTPNFSGIGQIANNAALEKRIDILLQ